MRAPLASLAAALALTACAGRHIVVIRQPAPATRPAPAPEPPPPAEPLEVTIGRPVSGRLLVQTNRPAYVAIFEILPERGVVLAHPSTLRERKMVLSGLSWVPVWWSAPHPGDPHRRVASEAEPVRYVYAIASDEPLRLPDEAFQPGYLRRTLGLHLYRATNPYATIRALSRHFAPLIGDDAWAEDMLKIAPTWRSDPSRVARIYCADRGYYDVPEELADRVWCPGHPRGEHVANRPGHSNGRSAHPVPRRPDSVFVFVEHGRRVRAPGRPWGRGPVDRVVEPVPGHDGRRNAEQGAETPGRGRALGQRDKDSGDPRGQGIERRDRAADRTPPPRRDPSGPPDKDEKAEKSDGSGDKKPEKGEKPDKPGRPDEPESRGVSEKKDHSEQPGHAEAAGKGEKVEKTEKPDSKPAEPEKTDRAEKSDSVQKADKSDAGDKADKLDKANKAEPSESEKPAKGEKDEKSAKPDGRSAPKDDKPRGRRPASPA